MKIDVLRQRGYDLMHHGVIALAQVEANGIRVDMRRLAQTKEDLGAKIRLLRQALEGEKLWRAWCKRYGSKANLGSRDQLAQILQEEIGFTSPKETAGGAACMDDEVLQNIDLPFVQNLARMGKYEKALGTFLHGIEKEVVDGRLHPVFNLHLARSYRSSSDNPNFQNMPVRDKEIAKIIRSLFIASPGGCIVENDFKGIEVGVSACYHKDPNFISYITSPGKDMHRDMAAQIYMMKPEEVTKDVRYGAKNKFVFPQFYGDFYVACARNLWEWIDKGKLTGPAGIPLKEHLAAHGIKKLGACDPEQVPKNGTFESHLKSVEDDFWNNRFRAYGQWRKNWYHAYLDKGHFDLYTGFRIYGAFGRNEVTNYPIQGSAFHCLLWSLIEVNKRLNKYKMKSKIVGQIHDSLIGDVPIPELGDYLCIVEEVATVRLRQHYDWLIVPLEIEYEIAPSEGTWFDKKEVKFKGGFFSHPKDPERRTIDPRKFMKALNQSAKEPHAK